jgi:RimJ/RimL family protein N-acetyltransferase
MNERHEPVRRRDPHSNPVSALPSGLRPRLVTMEGRYCAVEPLDAERHAAEIFAASHEGEECEAIWNHLPYGPFADLAAYSAWLRTSAASADPLFYAIRDRDSGKASGVASYLAIEPLQGTIEVGHIMLGIPLQNTRAATEALFLMFSHAMDDLRYRRLEWKCDAMNEASRNAAVRLGFAFEGIFYQHRISKGHNRDTAWYSILDSEWPALRSCFDQWLDPSNFVEGGRQRGSLRDRTAAFRASWG